MTQDFFLETERLIIRPWRDEEGEREIFHQLNSNQQIMKFFPFRRSRAEADEAMQRMNKKFDENGFGWCAVCLKETGQPIGFSGLATVDFGKDLFGEVEIGWRILHNHWRKGYASEAANRLLNYGFNDLNLQKIISFAVSDNIGSTAVMKKIGMSPNPNLDFDHPLITDDYAHLRRHVYYEITKSSWSNLGT